jgi:hypothetical protein
MHQNHPWYRSFIIQHSPLLHRRGNRFKRWTDLVNVTFCRCMVSSSQIVSESGLSRHSDRRGEGQSLGNKHILGWAWQTQATSDGKELSTSARKNGVSDGLPHWSSGHCVWDCDSKKDPYLGCQCQGTAPKIQATDLTLETLNCWVVTKTGACVPWNKVEGLSSWTWEVS